MWNVWLIVIGIVIILISIGIIWWLYVVNQNNLNQQMIQLYKSELPIYLSNLEKYNEGADSRK